MSTERSSRMTGFPARGPALAARRARRLGAGLARRSARCGPAGVALDRLGARARALLAASGAARGADAWPVRGRLVAYLLYGAAPLAVFLWVWIFLANAVSDGDASPAALCARAESARSRADRRLAGDRRCGCEELQRLQLADLLR